jgi:hypothetical protein
MIVNFYTDPVNINVLCGNLIGCGIAVMNISSSDFYTVTDEVRKKGLSDGIVTISVETPDHDWYHVLINTQIVAFHMTETEAQVQKAIQLWRAADYPFVYSLRC